MSTENDTCHIPCDHGTDVLMIDVHPEQANRYQHYADTLDIPLDRFMREAAEALCERIIQDEAEERVRREFDNSEGPRVDPKVLASKQVH